MHATELERDSITRYCLFAIDDETYIEMLPTTARPGSGDLIQSTTCCMGSIARCLDGTTYMLGGDDRWVEYTEQSGGGGGGGGGGSQSVAPNDVNFRDYDGTIVRSYSASNFAALLDMPANPSHSGLTAQGWNWTLADAKAYVAKFGRLEIGQMYITTSGKTRIYIHLEKGRTSPMLGVCPDGTVDVSWGDGTAHDTLTGTSTTAVKWTPNHTYAAPGDYVISLTVTGSMGFYGQKAANQYCGLLRYSSGSDARNRVYQNAIQKVEVGEGVSSIGNNAFYYCFSLSGITIPNTVTSIASDAFSFCHSLSSFTIPNGVTSIGSSAFSYCYGLSNVSVPNSVTDIGSDAFSYGHSLSSVNIPDGITSINDRVFYYCYGLSNIGIPKSVTSIGDIAFCYCYSLSNVTILDSVTNIGNTAFSYCYGVAEYHIKPTMPPVLSSTNAFSNIAADCVIYVPAGSLGAYKTATNWSSFADKMQEEPAS